MKTLTAVLALALAAGTAVADTTRVQMLSDAAAKSSAGDHTSAIALYEQAYLLETDFALLPIIGTEYRKANMPSDALVNFCQYLAVQPKGEHVAYSTLQVVQIRRDLGQRVAGKDVCAKVEPVRVDFVTPRRTKPTTKPSMSKREVAGIATAALGLASLSVGVYYHLEAGRISDQIASHPMHEPWPDNILEIEDRGKRAESRSINFALVGGAALVTGGVLYFLGRTDRLESENLVIAPTVTPDGGGISLSRGF